MLLFIFKLTFHQKNFIGSHRGKDSRHQDRYKAEFAIILPLPWHSPGKWSHTHSHLHSIHSLTHCLSGRVQPPPGKLSHKGHYSTWQAILERYVCLMTQQMQLPWTQTLRAWLWITEFLPVLNLRVKANKWITPIFKKTLNRCRTSYFHILTLYGLT